MISKLTSFIESRCKEIQDLEIIENVELNRQHHVWYGGDVATVTVHGKNYYVCANGDIKIELYNKETDDLLFSEKDRSNNGSIYSNLAYYVNSDEELEEIFEGTHSKYYIIAHDMNWWECFTEESDSWVLDSDNLTDAIIEVYDSVVI